VRMTWPDGTLPAHSQMAFQLAFTEWPVEILADTDRNGIVDNQDRDEKEQWRVSRGAFLPVDEFLSQGAANVPAAILTNLAPVEVRPIGVLPVGWKFLLKLDGNTNATLVATNRTVAGDMLQFGYGDVEQEIPAEWVLNEPLRMFAAANQDLGGFANKTDSIVWVTVLIRNEADELVAWDRVPLQVAPIILAWN